MPANLWDNSLQVRGSGPDGTHIIDVQSRNVFVEATPNAKIKELEELLNTLRAQDQRLTGEARSLDRENSVLDRIVTATTTVPAESQTTPANFDEWKQLLAFSATNFRRLDAAQRDLQPQRTALTAKIDAAQSQLNEARGRLSQRRAVKEVTVRVSSPSAGQGQLVLSYTAPVARWTPLYNARLDSPPPAKSPSTTKPKSPTAPASLDPGRSHPLHRPPLRRRRRRTFAMDC